MPSNFLLFDRIRELFRGGQIFQQERILQDQSSLDKILQSTNSVMGGLQDQSNLQIHRMQRYKDYEQMDETGEISLALDLYADEVSLVDSERKHTIIIRAKTRRIKKELEEFFFNTLLWDKHCRSAARYLCKFGCCPSEIVPNKNRDGISSLRFLNVYNFTRLETKFGDLVGFFYHDEYTTTPTFLHPWQVGHMRLTSFENKFSPYGQSILEGGRKAHKQLRLMEDAALIYRITRGPEKRIFKIPIGTIPAKEVPEYMQAVARMHQRQRFYNPTTGTFDERYSPLTYEDDYYLPRRADGTGPEVDTLKGGDNLSDIADIEYFKKKMVAPLKIPFSRVGIGEGSGEANEKSLSQTHAEFAKAVRWVQNEIAYGLTKIALVHLALRGYTMEDMRGFDLSLSSTSAMEELYRIETWQTRANVMSDLKDIGWFPKKWIVTHFTDLTPDELEDLEEMEEQQAGGDDMMGGGGGGALGGALGGSPGSDLEDVDEEDLDISDDEEDSGDEEGDELDLEKSVNKLSNVEGFDYSAEKRLLHEMRRNNVRTILNKANEDISNTFDSMLNLKELDGLSHNIQPMNTAQYVHSPNNDNGLLVEWSCFKDADDVIKETYQTILEARELSNSQVPR